MAFVNVVAGLATGGPPGRRRPAAGADAVTAPPPPEERVAEVLADRYDAAVVAGSPR